MARTLLQPNRTDRATTFYSRTGAPATPLLFLLLVVVAAAVAAVVVSLCTSGKNAGPRKQRRSSSLAPAPQQEQDGGGGSRNKQLLASFSGIGVKAAAVAKMVSWNRRSPPASGWSSGDGDDDDVAPDGDGTAEEEEALWKKTIILGDKCRPLQFSGHIAHDSDGNPMLPQPSAINKGDDPAAEG
ncbi:hypothetical protein BDA96_03G104100 [Sorghum bicolor]|uniref:Uncharacterized protein n=1 Tax=Sorghum bicolor TaxID=4558 RepID=A0A921RBY6_SORBI|nr:hypothetical protein BDA96_03G104100 [Sorghum bicolor]